MAKEHESRRAHWPEDVKGITLEQVDLLGVGPDNNLYWNGQPVVTQQRFALTAWQKFWAGLGIIAAIIGGLGGAAQGVNAWHDFGCKMHWFERGCSSGRA